MTVTLKLSCNGCFAKAEGTGPLRKRFEPIFNGSGWCSVAIEDPEDLAPEGWVMFDPFTLVTYCPTCWASIESSESPQEVERADG